jgi:hypothetical protein
MRNLLRQGRVKVARNHIDCNPSSVFSFARQRAVSCLHWDWLLTRYSLQRARKAYHEAIADFKQALKLAQVNGFEYGAMLPPWPVCSAQLWHVYRAFVGQYTAQRPPLCHCLSLQLDQVVPRRPNVF